LLQRKPDEWRRQHATPSSGGATVTPHSTARLSNIAAAPSALATPTNERDDPEAKEAGGSESAPPGRARKKRRRSAAADEIDALFDDAIGRKVVRSALEPAYAPAPSGSSKTKTGQGGQEGERIDRPADLVAVFDEMTAVPPGEGKKRRKRRRGPS